MLITRFLSQNFTKDSICIFILFSTYTYVSKRAFLWSSSQTHQLFLLERCKRQVLSTNSPDKHTLWVELHQHAFCINKSDHLSPCHWKIHCKPSLFQTRQRSTNSSGHASFSFARQEHKPSLCFYAWPVRSSWQQKVRDRVFCTRSVVWLQTYSSKS